MTEPLRDQALRLAHQADCLDPQHYGSEWADKLVELVRLAKEETRIEQSISTECPCCGNKKTHVLNTRRKTFRRRECLKCKSRWTTNEVMVKGTVKMSIDALIYKAKNGVKTNDRT